MAETKGYDVIVRLSQVVYVKKSLDITSDVLKELDKTLPTINVALPAK
jgi:Skp family chaperone for outer membrane proteins